MNTRNLSILGLVTVALIAAAPATAAERVSAEQSAPVTPFVYQGDLRDLPAPRAWQPGDAIKEIPRRFYPKPGMDRIAEPQPGTDPLVTAQRQFTPRRGSGGFTTPSRSFPGGGYTGVNPPDTVGDVGPAHYIQLINSGGGAVVRIWDKAEPTPALVTTFSLDSLGSGVCSGGLGDGIVLWDRFAERWMLSEFSGSGNNLCVYISQTPDPVSGGWFSYGFTAPSFPDYPKYGVWPTDANGTSTGPTSSTANDESGPVGMIRPRPWCRCSAVNRCDLSACDTAVACPAFRLPDGDAGGPRRPRVAAERRKVRRSSCATGIRKIARGSGGSRATCWRCGPTKSTGSTPETRSLTTLSRVSTSPRSTRSLCGLTAFNLLPSAELVARPSIRCGR